MDELFEQLTSKFGIDTSTAKSLTAKTMEVVKENVGGDLFSKIAAAVPGLSDLVASDSESESAGSAEGGLLGKIGGLAASVFGDKAGSGLELGTILAKAGLSADKLGGFLETIVEFVRDKAGTEVVEQLFEKFPMLRTLLK